jgi:beta-lactam-binding protein with PASTA domain
MPAARAQVPPATVPDVTGRPLETALAMIERAGLARGRIDERPSSGRPGIVLDQSLKPGTRVQRGTALHLAVAQEAQAIVPDVTNRPLDAALAMIDKAGLARGRVADRPSSGQPGIVLDQSIKPGTRVPRRTPLNLTLSQVQLVIVPDVMKLPVGDALGRIERAGLTRGNVTNREAPGPPDLVLEQSLRPGARVPRGTTLNLTLSQVQLVIVPDVMKLPLGNALTRIDEIGLARGTVTNREAPGPADLILEQSLNPGARVPRGTALNLIVSQAQPVTPPYVTNPPVDGPPAQPSTPVALLVPDVVGHSVAEATTLVGRARLTVGTVAERSFLLPPYFQPAGTVFQQQPAAGTPLASAVPVDLIVLPRVPAWAIIIPSAMLGAAIVLLLRRRPLSSPLKAPPPQVPLPTVVTRAYTDPGDQRIPSVMNPVSPEIRVRHTADPGTQSIREMLPSPH